MDTLLLSLIDGTKGDLGQGGLISILAILLVFAILAIIIAITFFVGKGIEKYSLKTVSESKEVVENKTQNEQKQKQNADLSDEDAVVAALVASIDYRNEIKKDIKVVSIKEIK